MSVLSAPAKLNLTLEVVHRLANGYHNIRSVFVRLDSLADTISLQIDTAGHAITIGSRSREIPLGAENICHHAAVTYLDAIGATIGAHITIEKVIPVAAGLGGGSSDAATVLLALNANFGNRLSTHELDQLGSRIGKDVPFFLSRAHTAYVSGMGEVVEPLTEFVPVRFLIINPPIAVSTAQAYRSLDESVWFMGSVDRADISRSMVEAIAAADVSRMAATLHNDFEVLLERQHPIIKEIKQALLAYGALGALMSGSGPTVFGMFDSGDALRVARQVLERRYPSFHVAAA
ncbi:MAG: 4-(cytidine 5'-diphospho)-2-C-methyl-D-erythritol kinase [Pseudomonadota bacterium]|nr:4-(cytidine 5'-diphospho)-2-C-methyl-D-erythritol kinase [Pseudomonadota bacterium]